MEPRRWHTVAKGAAHHNARARGGHSDRLGAKLLRTAKRENEAPVREGKGAKKTCASRRASQKKEKKEIGHSLFAQALLWDPPQLAQATIFTRLARQVTNLLAFLRVWDLRFWTLGDVCGSLGRHFLNFVNVL